MTYYYGYRSLPDAVTGVVYHYDDSGDKVIIDYRSLRYRNVEDALDDAAEWAERYVSDDHKLEME